jgi:hypothetical protein
MDKVIEGKEQYAELCRLLAAQRYDAMLLPLVLGNGARFLNALIVQEKRWSSPTLEKRNYTASFIYTVYTVYKTLCPNGDTWKDKSQPQRQGEE